MKDKPTSYIEWVDGIKNDLTMKYANADIHKRTLKKAPSTSRRRCQCGCKQRATHLGCANDIALIQGCELSVRRWVKGFR